MPASYPYSKPLELAGTRGALLDLTLGQAYPSAQVALYCSYDDIPEVEARTGVLSASQLRFIYSEISIGWFATKAKKLERLWKDSPVDRAKTNRILAELKKHTRPYPIFATIRSDGKAATILAGRHRAFAHWLNGSAIIPVFIVEKIKG